MKLFLVVLLFGSQVFGATYARTKVDVNTVYNNNSITLDNTNQLALFQAASGTNKATYLSGYLSAMLSAGGGMVCVASTTGAAFTTSGTLCYGCPATASGAYATNSGAAVAIPGTDNQHVTANQAITSGPCLTTFDHLFIPNGFFVYIRSNAGGNTNAFYALIQTEVTQL